MHQRIAFEVLLILSLLSTFGCTTSLNTTKPLTMTTEKTTQTETATFGAGCFWCVEAVFEQLDGVTDVKSGYMGGHVKKPTYEAICTGQSGHAEVTQIHYDPSKISYEVLLSWLWRSHNPTTLNQQGADKGTQYRSAIFYHSTVQQTIAEKSKQTAQANFDSPIVTEITASSTFYEAEEYHQDYYRLNKTAPYCQMVIHPKLKKLELE